MSPTPFPTPTLMTSSAPVVLAARAGASSSTSTNATAGWVNNDACAVNCLTVTTPPEDCEALDGACLCYSNVWHGSILSCLQEQCHTPFALDNAYSQLKEYCAAVGTPFETPEPAFTNSVAAASVSATMTYVPTTSDYVSLFGDEPIPKPVNVSAIMAAVCSLLLAGSLVIGYFTLKARLDRARAERERAQKGNWGGATRMTSITSNPGGPSSSTHAPKINGKDKGRAPKKSFANHITSSLFQSTVGAGGTIGTIDSFADREREAREERIDAARLARKQEADQIRQKQLNKQSLFFESPQPSTTSLPMDQEGDTHLTADSLRYNHPADVDIVDAPHMYGEERKDSSIGQVQPPSYTNYSHPTHSSSRPLAPPSPSSSSAQFVLSNATFSDDEHGLPTGSSLNSLRDAQQQGAMQIERNHDRRDMDVEGLLEPVESVKKR